MKNSLALLFSCFLAFLLPACEGDITENIPPPPGGNSWTYTGDKSPDGHYNVTFTNTSASCTKNLYPKRWTDWDFVEYGNNKGRLIFDGEFWWQPVELELDSAGNFKKTETTPPFFFLTSYIKQRLEISGRFDGNGLASDITFTLWSGADPNKLSEWCVIKFKASGKKRYKKAALPTAIIGEYGSAVSSFSGNCSSRFLDDHFVIDLIPQKETRADLVINGVDFSGAPLADGKINAKYSDGVNTYSLDGEFTPAKLGLTMNVAYANCSEKYVIAGQKRFEEAGKEKLIDGRYSARIKMIKNTCTSETYEKTAHLDMLQNGENEFLLRMDLLRFSFSIKPAADGKFSSKYDSDWYYYQSVMEGALTPDKLDATIKLHYIYKNCDLEFTVKGKKLYKHN